MNLSERGINCWTKMERPQWVEGLASSSTMKVPFVAQHMQPLSLHSAYRRTALLARSPPSPIFFSIGHDILEDPITGRRPCETVALAFGVAFFFSRVIFCGQETIIRSQSQSQLLQDLGRPTPRVLLLLDLPLLDSWLRPPVGVMLAMDLKGR